MSNLSLTNDTSLPLDLDDGDRELIQHVSTKYFGGNVDYHDVDGDTILSTLVHHLIEPHSFSFLDDSIIIGKYNGETEWKTILGKRNKRHDVWVVDRIVGGGCQCPDTGHYDVDVEHGSPRKSLVDALKEAVEISNGWDIDSAAESIGQKHAYFCDSPLKPKLQWRRDGGCDVTYE